MTSEMQRLVQHIFFFTVLLVAGFFVWKLILPFAGALSLAAIITTICYPLHERVLRRFPKSPSLSAFLSLSIVLCIVVVPLALLSSLIFKEAFSIYKVFNENEHTSFAETVAILEAPLQKFAPGFSIDIPAVVQQTAGYVVNHLVNIFTSTASTLFLFFIALIATYYFFRDGKIFTQYLVQLSPLSDTDDERILKRLATSVRSVALGTVLLAIIQGVLTAFGLFLFGFDRAILWGCVAALGALVPGVGTAIVFVPAVGYLVYTGNILFAALLGVWGALAVGLIDNMLGPYLMSRGSKMHPLFTLLSVLGGIAVFGPIGFVLGPVLVSFFLVLLELYHAYTKHEETL